jgi:hypothetical protein
MKSTKARMTINFAFCFSLFLVLTFPTQSQSEEYYIYRDPNGKLVISNNHPPPGSTIIKRQNLPELTDSQVQRSQEEDDLAKRRPESSTEPARNK